jgi:elongator complex protein 3
MSDKDSLERCFYSKIINFIKNKKPDKDSISKQKIILSKEYSLKKIPTDIAIMLNAPDNDIQTIKRYLLTKPGRTISGVAVVAIMSHPFPCPHGTCIMCPSNTSDGIPQSYTGKEPATRRGLRNDFDAYLQVMNRLEQYIATGHIPEKIELIIMGGTFPSFEKGYQESFVKDAFMAMNDFSDHFYEGNVLNLIRFKEFFELPGEIGSEERTISIKEKLLHIKNNARKTNLLNEQKKNETSHVKCVGLTIETRPDYCTLSHCNDMLKLGTTRVELGVQTVYNKTLERIERKHSVEDSIKATKTLKDLGFKINYHMMPGLPDVALEDDLNSLREIVDNPDFRPDMLKIYPCMVLKGTKLYDEWTRGDFVPLTTEKAAKLIAEFKQYVPEYMRIMRVQRDIPSFVVDAGVDRTNLRQYVERLKPRCRCIRCRELGHVYAKTGVLPDKTEIVIREYIASVGKEFFISIEDKTKDILLGFCRLRFPSKPLREEITPSSALIRELHVYGSVEGMTGKADNLKDISSLVQHKGIGKQLLLQAEEIAKENHLNKMIIISGIGAREYYRRLGYENEGPYMVKKIMTNQSNENRQSILNY